MYGLAWPGQVVVNFIQARIVECLRVCRLAWTLDTGQDQPAQQAAKRSAARGAKANSLASRSSSTPGLFIWDSREWRARVRVSSHRNRTAHRLAASAVLSCARQCVTVCVWNQNQEPDR